MFKNLIKRLLVGSLVISQLMIPTPAQASTAGKSINDIRIVLDPGHGGTDPGAIGNLNGQRINESDLVLDVALRTNKLLAQTPMNIHMTRSSDVFVAVLERARIANNLNADIFVSIHANSFHDSTANGTETYFFGASANSRSSILSIDEGGIEESLEEELEKDFEEELEEELDEALEEELEEELDKELEEELNKELEELDEALEEAYQEEDNLENYLRITPASDQRIQDSRLLAEKIQARLVSGLKLRDRGVKQENFGVLRETNMAAVLVELGFMSNPSDLAVINSEAGREAASEAIYLGILDYLVAQGYDVPDYLFQFPIIAPDVKLDVDLVRLGQARGDVNFRTGPGTKYNSIRIITSGTNMTIIGGSGTWYQVKIGNETGWINANNIDIINTFGKPTGNVNFRTGPGTKYRSMNVLSRDTNLVILGESNGWSQVRVGNQLGWINSNNIAQMNFPGQPTGNVNFRTGPGTKYSSIRTITRGTNLQIIGESNGWSQVRVGGQVGWINSNNIFQVGLSAQPTGTVNFRTGPGTRFSNIRTLNTGQNLEILGESNGWSNVRVGNETGWINSNNIYQMSIAGQSTGTVNFRTGPGTKYSSIRTLSKGSNTMILGESNGWSNVRVGNETGWINSNNIHRNGIASQPTGTVNFRRGPGTRFTSIRTLSRGTNLIILGEYNGWSLVRVGNEVGWINSKNLR